MTLLFTIPTQSYPTGNANIPARPVALGVTAYHIAIDITQMLDPATRFDISFEVSYDNGATWQFWVGAGREGCPVMFDRHGTAITQSTIDGPLEQPANSNRQIRGTVAIVGPITLGGTVSVT